MVDQQRGKSAKVLSLANCGMGAAVDIGVIREHVLGFLSMPLARRLRLYLCRRWALFVWRAAAETVSCASDDFVGEFALGEEVAVGYQRNELAKA